MSNILGLSVIASQLAYEKDTKIIKYRYEMADRFRAYAYGDDRQIGLHKILEKVEGNYSTDLDLILFFFIYALMEGLFSQSFPVFSSPPI